MPSGWKVGAGFAPGPNERQWKVRACTGPELKNLVQADAPWFLSPHYVQSPERVAQFYQGTLAALVHPESGGRDVVVATARASLAKSMVAKAFTEHIKASGLMEILRSLKLPAPAVENLDRDWIQNCLAELQKKATQGALHQAVVERLRRLKLAYSNSFRFFAEGEAAVEEAERLIARGTERPPAIEDVSPWMPVDPADPALAQVVVNGLLTTDGKGKHAVVAQLADPAECAPVQPGRLVQRQAGSPVLFHCKAATQHNATAVHAVLRAAVDDVRAAQAKRAECCIWTRLWAVMIKLLEHFDTVYAVKAYDAATDEAERIRGSRNREVGAKTEDSLFAFQGGSTGTPDELQVLALMLNAMERASADRFCTRFGSVPGAESTRSFADEPPPYDYLAPTESEVHAWYSWAMLCLSHQRCDGPQELAAFVDHCRAANRPALQFHKGVTVRNGRGLAGELDLVIYDAVSRSVLLICEVKTTASDLISARRQREKLTDVLRKEALRIKKALAADENPLPNADVGVVICIEGEPDRFRSAVPPPEGVSQLLDLSAFTYFREAPVYRWIMVSCGEVSGWGSRAPGRISWRLLREAGGSMGRCLANTGVRPDEATDDAIAASIALVAASEGERNRITAGMRHTWYPVWKKEGYACPAELVKESEGVNFTNLLLFRRNKASAS